MSRARPGRTVVRIAEVSPARTQRCAQHALYQVAVRHGTCTGCASVRARLRVEALRIFPVVRVRVQRLEQDHDRDASRQAHADLWWKRVMVSVTLDCHRVPIIAIPYVKPSRVRRNAASPSSVTFGSSTGAPVSRSTLIATGCSRSTSFQSARVCGSRLRSSCAGCCR